MKRKFTDMNGSSDSDDFSTFQSQRTRKRPRRQRICVSPLQSESDHDTIINNNDPNSQKISMLNISTQSKHINNNSQSSVSLSLSDENISKTQKQSSKWSCEMCTYENDNKFNKCQMCDSDRPHINNNNNNDIMDCNNSDNETDIELDSNEILNDIESEDNNFKKVISTKKLRKSKPKLKKQISIVDLTQNDTQIITKHKGKSSKQIVKKNNRKKKEQPKISCINGKRSRLDHYYSNKPKKINKQTKVNKQKKRKLTKTESIESIDESELLLNNNKNKKNNIECISDDDCVIIDSKKNNKNNKKSKTKQNINKKNKKTKQNGHVRFILDDSKINKGKLESEQWIDKYAPQHMDDLYLHSKKLNEMDKWFGDAFKSLDNLNNNKLRRLQYIKSVLFLVGQSGIGKTSTIECLCDKYNAKLLCYPTLDANVKTYNQSIWDNNKTHNMTFNGQNRFNSNIDIREPSQMNKFDIFLNRSKRFCSLNLLGNNNNKKISMNKRQVILIRELPYVGKDEYLYKFREIVLKMCNSTRNIVVFEITTEFEGTRDDLQTFGTDIRAHPRVNTIRFNPINNTLMKKCLNNILISENLKKYIINSKVLIDDIIQNEKGDLRNAIQTLQMRLVQLSYHKQISMEDKNNNNKRNTKNNKKSKKKNKSQMSSLKSLNVGGREETLSLFHCLGKILYAKKDMEPEEVIEKSDLDCIMFNDLLYENFGDYFVYNTHFMNNNNNNKKQQNDKPKQFDEFGFEIDMFDNEIIESEQDIVFEKYCQTLQYFSDADICCQFYNNLKYNDTSTDLRSNVNHIQFGSQLYPAIYSASISSRGYLISHNKTPKLKLPNNYGNNKYKKKVGGLNAIRGSTYKLVNKLKKELCGSFNDIILPTKRGVSFGMNQMINEHYVRDDELGLLRSFMCYPTSLYVDIFPLISNIKNKPIENECGVNGLCVSLIRTSNWYSQKYEWKTFQASRFDYIQKSITYNNNNGNKKGNDMESDDDDKHLIDEIEEFDDDSF